MIQVSKKGAIAIFVKTPGMSPVKTRLAAGVGEIVARSFYELSCQAVAGVCRKVQGSRGSLCKVFWAVAENDFSSYPGWSSLPCLSQGEGDLGKRLDTICRQLQVAYDYVMFMGGDCPQIRPEDLVQSISYLEAESGYTLGHSEDGGFWLWGGSKKVSPGTWQKVPYSQSVTGQTLQKFLQREAGVFELTVYRDVDTKKDLLLLATELQRRNDLLPEQVALRDWLGRQNLEIES